MLLASPQLAPVSQITAVLTSKSAAVMIQPASLKIRVHDLTAISNNPISARISSWELVHNLGILIQLKIEQISVDRITSLRISQRRRKTTSLHTWQKLPESPRQGCHRRIIMRRRTKLFQISTRNIASRRVSRLPSLLILWNNRSSRRLSARSSLSPTKTNSRTSRNSRVANRGLILAMMSPDRLTEVERTLRSTLLQ